MDQRVELASALKAEAERLGFDAVGIAAAVSPPGHAHLRHWLERGFAAGMGYMAKHEDARRHPESVLEGVRTVVMVAMSYHSQTQENVDPTKGKVARYARGGDYHRVLWDRLEELLEWVRGRVPEVRGRAVVDTAPLLERDFARLAGLGWIAKNTMLIGRPLGSFTVLGALLLDLDLPPDAPFEANHCGTCTRCLDACPTDAFAGPYQLDASRCISYWTIEHRGAVPEEWADRLEGWVFGCDICQEVCPWNRKAPIGRNPELKARLEWTNPDLIAWLEREEDEWRSVLRGTAQKRAKAVGLMRNAALVLGTRRVAAAHEALDRLKDHPDEGLQTAARWALRRLDEALL